MECPEDYKKSADGTVCEPRQYPFNRAWVPFPFCIISFVLFGTTMISWKLTKKETLIVQSTILQLAVVFQLMIIYELLKAMAEANALFIVCCILLLIINALINFAHSVTFRL